MTAPSTPLPAALRALRSNDLPRAEVLLRSHLANAPDDPEALRLLAVVAAAAGHAAESERLLRNAITLHPQSAAAHADLSSLLCRAGRADEALALLDQAAFRHPAEFWPLSIKTGVLAAERRDEEAMPFHEELVKRAPDATVVWMNYGHALAALGQADEAVVAYRKALALDPANGAAWWGLASLRTTPLRDADIRTMERALPDVGDPFQEVLIRFALGKAFADQERFEPSFEQYRKANALRGKLVPYDPRTVRALVSSHERVLSASFFAERSGCGHPADDPVFIVGMPRSGSTLVEQILASHPLVEGCGELFELQQIADALTGNGTALPDVLAKLGPDELEALGRRYLDATRRHRRRGTPRFTDKMPANWRYVALIRLILPNAGIVDVRRDPLPCCFSAFTTCFNRRTPFPTGLRELAGYRNDYVRMMDRVDAALPGHVHRVRYERLVEDPETAIGCLLGHLRLAFDPACLLPHQTRRSIHTPSAQQVRLPVNRHGLDQWRDYAPWLSPLADGLAAPEAPTERPAG